jgi:hypothetical protein
VPLFNSIPKSLFHVFFPKSFPEKMKKDILKWAKSKSWKNFLEKTREKVIYSIMLSFQEIH